MKHRWDNEILKTNSSCLNENQREDVIFKTAQDLKIHYDTNLWIPKEGLRFGIELFSALHYCPEHLIEAAKLSQLFESLITNENLNTVVAATMHNIKPRAGNNIKDFTAINMWYQRLDERYNLSLGEVILPLMNSDSVKHLEKLGPPYIQFTINMTNNIYPAKKTSANSRISYFSICCPWICLVCCLMRLSVRLNTTSKFI